MQASTKHPAACISQYLWQNFALVEALRTMDSTLKCDLSCRITQSTSAFRRLKDPVVKSRLNITIDGQDPAVNSTVGARPQAADQPEVQGCMGPQPDVHLLYHWSASPAESRYEWFHIDRC